MRRLESRIVSDLFGYVTKKDGISKWLRAVVELYEETKRPLFVILNHYGVLTVFSLLQT